MSFSVANKRVVVVGGGRSGRAAAELLASRGARVTLDRCRASTVARSDDRLGAPASRSSSGPHRPELFVVGRPHRAQPRRAAGSAGVSAARRAGVPVIGEVELASRWLTGRVIAITGTKGKSTTTTLTARMLRGGRVRRRRPAATSAPR